MQVSSAIPAQPDHDSRRVYPVKGGHFSSHLHRLGALQPLQRLDKKHSVVDVSVCSNVSVHAFSLKHKLLLHGGPFPSRRTARASMSRSNGSFMSGADYVEENYGAGRNKKIFKLSDASGA
jgi:hypothetical protein